MQKLNENQYLKALLKVILFPLQVLGILTAGSFSAFIVLYGYVFIFIDSETKLTNDLTNISNTRYIVLFITLLIGVHTITKIFEKTKKQ